VAGLAALLVFATVVLGGAAAALRLREVEARRAALVRRLEAIAGPAPGAGAPLLKDRRLSGIPLVDALLARVPLMPAAARMIRRAGLERRAGELLLAAAGLGVAGFLAAVLAGGGPAAGLAAGAVAGAIPLAVVRRLRTRRAELFAEQLPDALDLVRAALQAGHGLVNACALVGEEFPEPIAREFRELTHEIRHGLPLRDALYGLCDRVDNPELPLLAIGILIAQETGGNLAEVLDNITYTIRERFKLLRETRVLTAQGRLSGIVLTVLPFAVGFLLWATSPDYFGPMLGDPRGRGALACALASVVCGHLVIRRLTSIRV